MVSILSSFSADVLQTEDELEECSVCEPWNSRGAQLLNSKQGFSSSPLEMALGHLKSVRAGISEVHNEKQQLYWGCEKVN